MDYVCTCLGCDVGRFSQGQVAESYCTQTPLLALAGIFSGWPMSAIGPSLTLSIAQSFIHMVCMHTHHNKLSVLPTALPCTVIHRPTLISLMNIKKHLSHKNANNRQSFVNVTVQNMFGLNTTYVITSTSFTRTYIYFTNYILLATLTCTICRQNKKNDSDSNIWKCTSF